MIVRYENDCVCCSLPCIHCGRDVDRPIHACDNCGEENVSLYYFDEGEYCKNCIFEILDLEEVGCCR